MKQLLIVFACLTGILSISAPGDLRAEEPLSELAHQVGLIDMAYVFKNSRKFLSLTESLQQEIEKTDNDAKVIVDRIRQLQAQHAESTPAAQAPLEQQIASAKAELETFKRVAQQSFLRKEADIYKTVYLEVEEAVRRYAIYYKYTLVLRFDRNGLQANDSPHDVMNGMNRQVVHYESHDDMTEPVLKFLNSEWEKQEGALPAGKTSGQPAAQKDVKFRFGGVEFTR